MDCVQFDLGAKYRLRIRAKVQLKPNASGEAFSFGIWHPAEKKEVGKCSITASAVQGKDYAWYDGFEFTPADGCLLWVAPGFFDLAKSKTSPVHDGIWIDCLSIERVDEGT